MWYLAKSVDYFDLIQGVDGGRQAAVNTENLVIDDDAEGEKIEHICEIVPYVGVSVFARAFGVEAI